MTMRGFQHRLGAAVAAALVAAGTAAAASPFDELLRHVPEDANCVLFVNVRAIYSSQVGRDRHWHQNIDRCYNSGLCNLPPAADRVVVAQRTDPSTLQAAWRIELVQLDAPVNIADVARHVGGHEDKVADLDVVLSPRGSYFVAFNPRLAGEAYPADRQKLGRWIRFCEHSSRPVVSRYLQQAAEDAGEGAQAILAMDLQDVFDLPGVTRQLKTAKSLEGRRGVDRDAIAKTLAGIRGLQIRVRVDREINGEIRLDFSSSGEPLHVVAKDFIIDVMESMGASVEDLNDPNWRARVEGNSVILAGPLTERGARLLMSPAQNRITLSTYAQLTRTEAAPPDPKAATSQLYFRSLTSLLDELNTDKDTRTISKRGYWYQQYANKVDSLPVLNVDDELLTFGAQVSQALRAMANLGSRAKTQHDAIQNQIVTTAYVVPGTYAGYGAWGAYGWNYTGPAVGVYSNYWEAAALAQQTAATEKNLREQTWANINQARQEMRKKMVQKYKIEF
jgi:hypothetical protein